MAEELPSSLNGGGGQEGSAADSLDGRCKTAREDVNCTEEQGKDMAPWEQHAAVINLPRFDYAAPSSLLQRSRSGFLITCPIKREKSATKEAISLLKEFVDSDSSKIIEGLQPCATTSFAKRRRICTSTDATGVDNVENADNTAILASKEGDEKAYSCLNLSLVKLTRSGLLLFTFPGSDFHKVVDVFSNVLHSVQDGKIKGPLWCNRIFPIQETCILTEEDLHVTVSKLVQEHFGNERDKLDRPIKFAVGYNRRGFDVTEKTEKSASKTAEKPALLDRETCFKVVAGAVKSIATNSVVDLKCPEVTVLVELLPVSGLPSGSLVVGVSVLPLEFVSTKPRLCVRSLIADTKVTRKKI